MSANGQYDVIIIGSGAGGGTLARALAPSGKRILILERGGWLPRELENWDAEEVFVKNRTARETALRRIAPVGNGRAGSTWPRVLAGLERARG
jgi:choline dehydrogenase-like flavoprotein